MQFQYITEAVSVLHTSKSTNTLQNIIFYSTYNLTRLGRDKLIYGFIIIHF